MMRAIEIVWDGKTYTVPENKAFLLAEEVEEIIALGEFNDVLQKMQTRKISRCFSIMLNFVGLDVSAEQVFQKLGGEMIEKKITAMMAFHTATAGLAAVLTNGLDLQAGSKEPAKKATGSLEAPISEPASTQTTAALE